MSSLIPFGASELTTDADSGTQGVVIWLGTRSKKTALRHAPELVPYPEEMDNIGASRERDRNNRRKMAQERKEGKL